MNFAVSIPDFRRTDKGNIRYRLEDIIMLMALGRASGCVGRADIIEFGRHNFNRLRKLGLLRNGVPSEPTLCRIENGINDVAMADSISSFYTFVKLKLDGPPTLHQRPKVLCMLQDALYEMMDIRMAHCEMQEHRQSRREEIMARFILSICKHFHTERQVSFYAKELCITPKHLSSVVKETSGRTAGEWIDHYVIMEAKMLLASTDMTVQEISSRLNFANQSFFGKYFKHHTGDSPTEFRHKHAATETSPGIDSIGPES